MSAFCFTRALLITENIWSISSWVCPVNYWSDIFIPFFRLIFNQPTGNLCISISSNRPLITSSFANARTYLFQFSKGKVKTEKLKKKNDKPDAPSTCTNNTFTVEGISINTVCKIVSTWFAPFGTEGGIKKRYLWPPCTMHPWIRMHNLHTKKKNHQL